MNNYERLDEYIEKYKEDPINTLHNMRNYYDNEDDCWFVIEELLDKLVGENNE